MVSFPKHVTFTSPCNLAMFSPYYSHQQPDNDPLPTSFPVQNSSSTLFPNPSSPAQPSPKSPSLLPRSYQLQTKEKTALGDMIEVNKKLNSGLKSSSNLCWLNSVLQSLSCTPLLLMLQGKLPISFKLEQLVIFIYYSTAFNRFDSTSSKLCGPNAKPQEH